MLEDPNDRIEPFEKPEVKYSHDIQDIDPNRTNSVTAAPERSRRDRVKESILKGHPVSKVVIPSYFQGDDHILYELDISNGKLRWNLWYRFQEFYELHVTLSEVAASLSGKFPVILPPFPSRAIKYVQDHFDPEFIELRKMLLENYTQKLVKSPDLAYCEALVEFLMPKLDEDDSLFVPSKRSPVENVPNFTSESSLVERQTVVVNDSPIELSDNDDVTAVSVTSAQIISNDHAVFQLRVQNSNKRKSFSEWTVMKRFADFVEFDQRLRQHLSISDPFSLSLVPTLCMRQPKVLVDHLDPIFIERRRLELNLYMKKCIKPPRIRQSSVLLVFLQVEHLNSYNV